MHLRVFLFGLVLGVLTMQSGLAQNQGVDPARLVVMIEGRTPSGAAVKGAGLVVGRLRTGEPLVVTAKHVTHTDTVGVNKLELRFFDSPDVLAPGRVLPNNFGKDLDLAVIAVDPRQPHDELDLATKIPVGRLDDPVRLEERVALIGQTAGGKWSTTSRNQMVTADQGNSVRINSPEAGPGVSGGVAVDASDRIIGIALNDDRYVITVLKLSVIATQLRSAGLPFSITHGETRIASPQDFEAGLRAALRSRDDQAVTRFAPDRSAVAIVGMLLDEPETLKAFSSNLRSDVALAWLDKLVASGFDPNRLVTVDGRQRPLLRAAIGQNNSALAVALLNAGATPYMYDELWGQEFSMPYFLFPLEALSQFSGSEAEKKALVTGMVRAGLTTTELAPPDTYKASEQMQDVHGTQRELASRFGLSIPSQNGLDRSARATPCARLRSTGSDWCKLIANLPSRLVTKSTGWHMQFQEATIVKPLAVIDDHLYVMTFSVEGGNAPTGYGLMRVSKDADELVWYRFMGSGFGLGHCEELRGVANWKPDGGYRQCWRRQVMQRAPSRGVYTVQGYRNVEYESIR